MAKILVKDREIIGGDGLNINTTVINGGGAGILLLGQTQVNIPAGSFFRSRSSFFYTTVLINSVNEDISFNQVAGVTDLSALALQYVDDTVGGFNDNATLLFPSFHIRFYESGILAFNTGTADIVFGTHTAIKAGTTANVSVFTFGGGGGTGTTIFHESDTLNPIARIDGGTYTSATDLLEVLGPRDIGGGQAIHVGAGINIPTFVVTRVDGTQAIDVNDIGGVTFQSLDEISNGVKLQIGASDSEVDVTIVSLRAGTFGGFAYTRVFFESPHTGIEVGDIIGYHPNTISELEPGEHILITQPDTDGKTVISGDGVAETIRQGTILPGNSDPNENQNFTGLPTSYRNDTDTADIPSVFAVGDLFLHREVPTPLVVDQATVSAGIWALRPVDAFPFTTYTWTFLGDSTQWNEHIEYFVGQTVIQVTDDGLSTTYLAKTYDGTGTEADNINIEPGAPSPLWMDYWTLIYAECGINQGVNLTQSTPEPGIADATFKTIELFDRFGSDGLDPIRGTRWELAKEEGSTDADDRATLPEIVDASKWGIAPTGTKPNDISWNEVISPVVHDSITGVFNAGSGPLAAGFSHPAADAAASLLFTLPEGERDIVRNQFFIPKIRAIGPLIDGMTNARVIDRVENVSGEPNQLRVFFEGLLTVLASDDANDAANIEIFTVAAETIHTIEGGTYSNGILTIEEETNAHVNDVLEYVGILGRSLPSEVTELIPIPAATPAGFDRVFQYDYTDTGTTTSHFRLLSATILGSERLTLDSVTGATIFMK